MEFGAPFKGKVNPSPDGSKFFGYVSKRIAEESIKPKKTPGDDLSVTLKLVSTFDLMLAEFKQILDKFKEYKKANPDNYSVYYQFAKAEYTKFFGFFENDLEKKEEFYNKVHKTYQKAIANAHEAGLSFLAGFISEKSLLFYSRCHVHQNPITVDSAEFKLCLERIVPYYIESHCFLRLETLEKTYKLNCGLISKMCSVFKKEPRKKRAKTEEKAQVSQTITMNTPDISDMQRRISTFFSNYIKIHSISDTIKPVSLMTILLMGMKEISTLLTRLFSYFLKCKQIQLFVGISILTKSQKKKRYFNFLTIERVLKNRLQMDSSGFSFFFLIYCRQ